MTVFPDDLVRGYRVSHCSVCRRPSVFKICRFCRAPRLEVSGPSETREETEEGTR